MFVLFLQSLKSCGYVKEQFAWRHFYWYLTNEGIQYLRDFLHLPPEIVPATLRRQTRPETARPRPKGKLTDTQIMWDCLNVACFCFSFVCSACLQKQMPQSAELLTLLFEAIILLH